MGVSNLETDYYQVFFPQWRGWWRWKVDGAELSLDNIDTPYLINIIRFLQRKYVTSQDATEEEWRKKWWYESTAKMLSIELERRKV